MSLATSLARAAWPSLRSVLTSQWAPRRLMLCLSILHVGWVLPKRPERCLTLPICSFTFVCFIPSNVLSTMTDNESSAEEGVDDDVSEGEDVDLDEGAVAGEVATDDGPPPLTPIHAATSASADSVANALSALAVDDASPIPFEEAAPALLATSAADMVRSLFFRCLSPPHTERGQYRVTVCGSRPSCPHPTTSRGSSTHACDLCLRILLSFATYFLRCVFIPFAERRSRIERSPCPLALLSHTAL